MFVENFSSTGKAVMDTQSEGDDYCKWGGMTHPRGSYVRNNGKPWMKEGDLHRVQLQSMGCASLNLYDVFIPGGIVINGLDTFASD